MKREKGQGMGERGVEGCGGGLGVRGEKGDG